jgi:DNA polymerase-1
MPPGESPLYLAWGHAEGNGIYEQRPSGKMRKLEGDPKKGAHQRLQHAYRNGGVLGHNVFKFDLDVAETHMGLKAPAWDRVHDTLFTLFLKNPHAPSLRLKDSAAHYLGTPPEERDAVYDWLAQHGVIPKPRTMKGNLTYAKDAGRYICKAPGDVVAPYAIGDLTRTLGLFNLHHPEIVADGMREAYDVERELAPILLDNERRGMRVDMDRLAKDIPVYEKALAKCERWIRRRLDRPGLNIDSDEDVARALHRAGVVPAFPKTPTGRDSVSKKNLTMEYFTDRDVFLAMVYRNGLDDVLKKNLLPWIKMASENDGYIFTEWNQVRQGHADGFTGARSGRITCTWFQNIVKSHTDKGDDYTVEADLRIRKLIGLPPLPLSRTYCLADAGETFVHRDYNQQELRLVAHYEEGALAEAYRTNPDTDIHDFVRDLILRVTGRKYERRPVKIIDFRTVYGGGVAGLALALRIPYHEAKEMVDGWRTALPDVVDLDRELKDRFREGKPLRTYGGRLYHCKPPAIAKKGPRKGQLITFEYTALNYLIQPSGADVTKRAILRYHAHPKRRGRMLAAVHDEINLSAKLAKQESAILKECMESVKIDVPWRTQGKLGPSWGSLEKE